MKKVFFIIGLLLSLSANAFTETEKTLLQVVIFADQTASSCVASGNDVCVADFLNTPTGFISWRSSVTQNEYQTREDLGTMFNWSGPGGFISRTQGERDAWRAMFQGGMVNPSKSNVIAAFNDIFSGTGAGAVANRAHLLAVSKRVATNAEKALASGAGTTQSPGIMTFEGTVGINDVPSILGR